MSVSTPVPTSTPAPRTPYEATRPLPAPSRRPAPNPPAVTRPAPVLDNRPVYLAWGGAWLVGHGAFALTAGDSPVVDAPGWLAGLLLAVGLIAAAVVTGVCAARDKKAMHGEHRRTAAMLGNAWLIGFTGLAALIVGTATAADDQHLQTLLWPTGSALVVGLLYLAGGAVHRDRVQYALGAYLSVVGTGAVALGEPGTYAVLSTAGVAGYLVAAAVEPGRVRAAHALQALR